MSQPTPQQQAENMMKGIKNAYKVVAVRHVHPWYSWTLMAVAIGFTVGAAYVGNLQGQFNESMAASEEAMRAMDQEIADPGLEVADPGPIEEVVTTFASNGNEKVAVFIPEIKKIEQDDDSLFLTVIAAGIAIIGVPSPLDFIGVAVGNFVGSVVGATGSFFNTIISGQVTTTVNAILNDKLPILPGLSLGAGRVVAGINAANSGDASDAIQAEIFRFVGKSAIDEKAPVANQAVKAVQAEAKQARAAIKKDFRNGTFKLTLTAADLPKIEKAAIEGIRKSQKKYNPILANEKIATIKKVAIAALSEMQNPKKVSNVQAFNQKMYETRVFIESLANNTSGKITTITINSFGQKDKDHYLEYDRVNRTAVVLPADKKPWEATIPGSSWIGFRKNLDVAGKGPRKYTIMAAIEDVTVSGTPTEGILTFMTTNKQADVRVNGVKVYSVPPRNNQVLAPTTAIVLDITSYLLPGVNKIAVYTVQAGEKNQRFGIDFAGYIKSAVAQ